MTDWRRVEEQIARRVRLSRRPVAVSFLDSPAQGIPRFAGTEPSACGFWRLAAEGRTVCAAPADHVNCAVGRHALNIDPSLERVPQAEQAPSLMLPVDRVRHEETETISQLPITPAAIVYSPLSEAPVSPSVVLFTCRLGSAVLLQEAGLRASKSATLPALGRLTCMALPAALAHGTVMSLGCIESRAYTGLTEDELYVAIRGLDLVQVADALDLVASANAQRTACAERRRAELSAE